MQRPPPSRHLWLMVVALRPAVASLALTTLSTVLGPKPAVSIGDGIEIRLKRQQGCGAVRDTRLGGGTFLGRYTGKLMDEAQALAAYQNGDSSGSYFATIEKGPFGGTPLVVDAEDDRPAPMAALYQSFEAQGQLQERGDLPSVQRARRV